MLINEVVVKEAYREDLLIAVQDLLTYAMKRNIAKISTEKFKSALAKQGYVASTEEIISAVDMSALQVVLMQMKLFQLINYQAT